jgi:hypothetical protein
MADPARSQDSISRIVLLVAFVLFNLLVGLLVVKGLSISLGWVVVGLASFYLLLGCVLLLPTLLVPSRASVPEVDDPKDRIDLQDERLRLQNDLRGVLLQAVGGTALLVGILFTWHQFQIERAQLSTNTKQVAEQIKLTQDQLALARRSQIAELFSQAVNELQQATTESRLGAVATLEQVAVASGEDRAPAIRQLTGFVRSVSRFKAPDDWANEPPLSTRPPEVQAAVEALGRLHAKSPIGPADPPLDLTGAYLVRAQLAKVSLGGAALNDARLQGADLNGAILQGASFGAADLRGANLSGADLRGADLTGANLADATLDGTTKADEQTKWPADFDPCAVGLQLPTC